MWLGQRTRWLKGWMQTYIVHTRHPIDLWRDLGTRRFCILHVVMGGFVLSALVHPWFYVVCAAEIGFHSFLAPPQTGAGRVLWWIAMINLAAGYLSAVGLGLLAVIRQRRYRLVLSCLAMPIYWLAISLAAYRALWQLAVAPHYWEKTKHKGMRPSGASLKEITPKPGPYRVPFERSTPDRRPATLSAHPASSR